MRFVRKHIKPEVINAVQLTRETLDTARDLMGARGLINDVGPSKPLWAIVFGPLAEGDMRAVEGDWIVRREDGSISVCTPGSFRILYEAE